MHTATKTQIEIITLSGLEKEEFHRYGGEKQYWSYRGKDDDGWIRTCTLEGDRITNVLRSLMAESAWGEC